MLTPNSLAIHHRLFLCLTLLTALAAMPNEAEAGDAWPQGSGPDVNFRLADGSAPQRWSVTRDENIRWKVTLPETGQSTVTVWRNRLFFSTLKPVDADSQLGSDIVAYCCDAETGRTIWKRDITAKYPLRLSGCFSDSSAPPPVTDGRRVCFFNASGRVTCFDFDGNTLWSQEVMAVGRSQPFLSDGSVVFTRQNYMPDEHGHFTHEHKDAPLALWTQLQALDLETGAIRWTSQCGVNMGCVPVPHTLDNGRQVIMVGRGGGHSPPEKPEGVSMIDATDGSTIWTLPLKGFMSTMTLNIHGDHALVFHGSEHLWVDVATGRITKRVSIGNDVSVRRRIDGAYQNTTETLPIGKKPRAIIQSSNILVGDYHYFRSYTHPWLGRVNVGTGKLEYLELPLQLKRSADSSDDQLLWHDASAPSPARKDFRVGTPVSYQTFARNDMKNSRGFVVMGDARSKANGWGHHASAVPTAIGERLYMPIMTGTVYVIDWNAAKFDENALIAVNDLGPAGQAWNRASLSFAHGRIYAHTIRELICIGD